MVKRIAFVSALMALVAGGGFAACADFQDGPDLVWTPQPYPDYALAPRLAGPGSDGVNGALDALDSQAQTARSECLAAAGEFGSWLRTVWTPYVGPRFLTVAVNDQAECGGAHPFNQTTFYTFDRQIDDVPDWQTLWPGAAIVHDGLAPAVGPARTNAPAIWRWYAAAVAQDTTVDPELRRLCADLYQPGSDGEAWLEVWLDGASGGLGVRLSDLPHAVQACNTTQIMPADDMARLGASDPLLDAVRAAPAAFDYSEMPR